MANKTKTSYANIANASLEAASAYNDIAGASRRAATAYMDLAVALRECHLQGKQNNYLIATYTEVARAATEDATAAFDALAAVATAINAKLTPPSRIH